MFGNFLFLLLTCWTTVVSVHSCAPTQSYIPRGEPGLNGLSVNPGAIGNARSPIYGSPSLAGTVGTTGTLGGYGLLGRRRRAVEDSFARVVFEFGEVTDVVEAVKILENNEPEYSKILPSSDQLYPLIFEKPHYFTVENGKLKMLKLLPIEKHECRDLEKLLSTVSLTDTPQTVTVKC